jgi:Ca2+-binding EF-hand superfamily protein
MEFIARLLNKDFTLRPEANALIKNKWLNNVEIEKLDEMIGVGILNKMAKFTLGKSLRRSVLSYIYTRKLYSDNDLELQKLFQEIDSNHDGVVDFDEFAEKYAKYFPGSKRQVYDKMKSFFDSMDIDKTGSLSYSEFLTINTILNKELCQNTLREIFNFYDFDNNGYIEADDIKEIFEDTLLTDEGFQKIIDEYDDNGDRRISFEEFSNMIISYY